MSDLTKYLTPAEQKAMTSWIQARKKFEEADKWARSKLLEVMQENNLDKIVGDRFVVTKLSRDTIKFTGLEAPAKYLTKSIDMAKVKADLILKGKMPEGFESYATPYITIKEVK